MQSCRACAFPLPASGICRDCGEDHRGWVGRLRSTPAARTLQAQEAEIRAMRAEIAGQRAGLEAEAARLSQHRAATSGGQAVIDETRERVARGLEELRASERELEGAALAVVAVRARTTLEVLRASEPGAPERLPIAGGVVDPETGIVVGRAEGRLQAWSPVRPLRPLWSVEAKGIPAPSWPFCLADPARLTVLDPADGHVRWTAAGELLDAWDGEALVLRDGGIELRGAVDGEVRYTAPGAPAWARRVPGGFLAWDPHKGLAFHGPGGRLAERRTSSNLVLGADRRTLLAFPMVLRIPELEPIVGLTRPPDVALGSFWLDDRVVLAWSSALVVWRLPSAAPAVLNVPVRSVDRIGDALLARAGDEVSGFSLDRWPPRRLEAFELARIAATRPCDVPPERFRLGADTRVDRARVEPAAYCHDLARWAAQRAREGSAETRAVAGGLARDALVVEAEVLTREAGRLAAELAAGAHDLAPLRRLLDRLFAPMFLLDSLTVDEASDRRVRGLLASCAEAVLSAVGERISGRALRGEAEDGEIEAAVALLAAVRQEVLARAPGLRWTGLDALMARWKQLGQQARELADVAVATRALGKLAQASSVTRGQGSTALERLGRSIGDLAARSAADAEVDALLTREGLESRVAEGMERVKRELGRR